MYPKGYGIVFKKFLENPNISASAKGLYALIASYTGNNDFSWPSHAKLAKCMRVTRRTIITFLDELEKNEVVFVHRTPGGVNKYALHIPETDLCNQLHNPVKWASQPCEVGFTDKINNSNNNETSIGFDAFWSLYPRKINKAGTLRAWGARKKAGELVVEEIMAATAEYTKQMAGRDINYVMHPSTFIGPNLRWKDYVASGPKFVPASKEDDSFAWTCSSCGHKNRHTGSMCVACKEARE